MLKDYYVVLGVPLEAAPDAIRSAYRRLALRYHPDRGDESSSRTFREVAEAYDVLSNPERRARYDRMLQHSRRPARTESRPAAGTEPEPLISEPVFVADRPDTVRPSLEALIERFASNFAGLDTPKAERLEPLNFELILSRDEAERGLRVPFRVPVFAICRLCGGSGRDWMFSCRDCGGTGRLVDRAELQVEVPSGVRDRTCLDVSLDGLGIRNLWLRLHIRVTGH